MKLKNCEDCPLSTNWGDPRWLRCGHPVAQADTKLQSQLRDRMSVHLVPSICPLRKEPLVLEVKTKVKDGKEVRARRLPTRSARHLRPRLV